MIPHDIVLHQKSGQLSLYYPDGSEYALSCEYLRVYSPSAEVTGHGPGQDVLQVGKENVSIERIEPVGQYALKFVFDDGHNSGIYSWDYLLNLAQNYDSLWSEYLKRLNAAGYKRLEKQND